MARQIEAAAWAKRPLMAGAGSGSEGGSSSRGGSSSKDGANIMGSTAGDGGLGTQRGVGQVNMLMNVHFLILFQF